VQVDVTPLKTKKSVKRAEVANIVRGTAFITVGGDEIYCSEGSQVMHVCHSGNDRLEAR
jgi:hypothetical protein